MTGAPARYRRPAAPLIVAIQGARGSFSEGAARALAGGAARLLSCETFSALFDAVAAGRAHRGVVPVHNTIAGPVYDNARRARAAPFAVLGQLSYPVRQCLIARGARRIGGLRRVASHPVALRQCLKFFASNPQCTAVEAPDTGGAVRDLMAGTLAVDAVIAPVEAARIYGAAVLVEGVEDVRDNFTEFLLIARSGGDRGKPA